MSIVDGVGLVEWEGGLFEPGSDLLRRLQWAFARIRADGGTIILNEAGRPYGVPGDTAVGRAGLPETRTASGRSTVYYQWGRMLGGYTPSAADPSAGPLASEHTQGKAADTNAPTDADAELRRKYFGMVGLFRTIPSESWHFAIRRDPEPGVQLASAGKPIPIHPQVPEEDDDMPTLRGAEYTGADGQRRFMLFSEISGFCAEHSGASGAYNNPISLAWETNGWAEITAKHADVIRKACAEVRARKG